MPKWLEIEENKYLITESKVCMGNIKLRPCCIDSKVNVSRLNFDIPIKTKRSSLISTGILLCGIFSKYGNNTDASGNSFYFAQTILHLTIIQTAQETIRTCKISLSYNNYINFV